MCIDVCVCVIHRKRIKVFVVLSCVSVWVDYVCRIKRKRKMKTIKKKSK